MISKQSTNTQKRCPFHYRGLECKSRKSRNTWSNRQIWPWNTEWSRAKTNRVSPRERTGHSKHPLPTTQEKTLHIDITRWSTLKSDWLYSLQQKMECWYSMGWGLWHCTGDRDQDHPPEKEMQKAKWLSGEALQIAVKRRSERQRRKAKIYPSECRVLKNSKER